MSNNTGIRIEATKEVISNGKIGFRILSIAALPQDKLPDLYLDADKKPIVWLADGGNLSLGNNNEGNYWIQLNSFCTTTKMEKCLTHIREAGQHLTDVNAHLRKEREAWNGKVVFVDGIAEQESTFQGITQKGKPIELAERIAEPWREGRLLYRNEKGHIKPLK